MIRATNFRAPCGVRVAGIFNSICIACAGKTSYLSVIFPDLHVLIFNFFSHISTTKMMFWALARVSFRAAKIVSCNKNFYLHRKMQVIGLVAEHHLLLAFVKYDEI
jgi:hypothetical protein